MTMYPIASVVNPAGGVVAFTNIPQTFQHLQIRAYVRTTYNGAENLFMRINNTFANSYSGHYLAGTGASVLAGGYGTTINYMDMSSIANASHTAGVFATYIIDILDYTSTSKFKTVRCIGGFDNNGSGDISLRSGAFHSLSAITEITQIGGTAGNGFAAGTRFDLYGVHTAVI